MIYYGAFLRTGALKECSLWKRSFSHISMSNFEIIHLPFDNELCNHSIDARVKERDQASSSKQSREKMS